MRYSDDLVKIKETGYVPKVSVYAPYLLLDSCYFLRGYRHYFFPQLINTKIIFCKLLYFIEAHTRPTTAGLPMYMIKITSSYDLWRVGIVIIC